MAKLATVATVVKRFGLSASTWRRLADRKLVRCVRLEHTRAYDLEDCERISREGVPKTVPTFDQKAARAKMRRINAEFRARHAE